MSNHQGESDELHFEQIGHKGISYEDRDLGSRAIIVFMVVLVVTTAVLCLLVWGYFDYRIKEAHRETPVAAGEKAAAGTPSGFVSPEERFPKPALQTDEVLDMNKFRIQEENILNSYGWVDQKAGIVHIPIDQAMAAVAKQGLPTRPAAPQAGAAQFGNGSNTVPGVAGGTVPAVR